LIRVERISILPPNSPLRTAEESPLRKSNVLVVDDEELYRRALERILSRAGHAVTMARDASDALAILSKQPMDVVLVDVKMPGINGLELVRQIREISPDLPCIVITGFGGAEASVEALRAGAFWYLEKPFDQAHLDVVRRLVEQAIELGRLKTENRILHTQIQDRYRYENIVGSSEGLRRVLGLVSKVAESTSTVLITGESGTGKELVARAIHYNSRRAEQMFVTVNCGAIPEELLESELFGHVKGAFTNAVNHREGRFSVADNGTIFLDEIGDMSPNLQVKLLRVLQDKTFEPVGSSKPITVNIRVIAATNQKLEERIRDRLFREDLFYRLNVIPIEVPPLRERRDDIPLLAQHFLEVCSQERGTAVDSITRGAMEALMAYNWPGNVRELENMIERVVILGDGGEIGLEDLPREILTATGSISAPQVTAPKLSAGGLSLKDVVDRFESDLILQALEKSHWNKNQAAKLLDVNRTTLVEKIKKKGLVDDRS